MADAARARKLAGRIHEIVAQLMRKGVKDPRLGMVTITDARITADLREATVYYTVMGDAEEQAATAVALESAKGVIRSAVGHGIGIKFTPSLTFVHDEVPETARHMDELLAVAHAADEQVRSRAIGATYAGESDPYRESPLEEESSLESAEDEPLLTTDPARSKRLGLAADGRDDAPQS